jgi:hypothetical protein
MNANEISELVMEVRDAQEKMFEAIEQVEQVLRMLDGEIHTASWKAYWLDHMKIAVSSDHSFLSRDKNLDELIQEIQHLGSCPDAQDFETEEAYYDAIAEWEGMRC